MNECLLFLDFDGVLHPYGCTVDRYFEKADLVEGWLRRHPSVNVVVSSSWREQHSLDEMRGFFSEKVAARLIGATPVLRQEYWQVADPHDPLPMYEREVEVTRWLEVNDAKHVPWAALDDQAGLFRPFNKRLVVCHSAIGLTHHDLDLLDAVLGGQR